jgi:hypothetical protein
VPFHSTTEEVTNPEPVAVMTRLALPAIAEDGASELNTTGAGAGVGAGVGAEDDPPPQPAAKIAKHIEADTFTHRGAVLTVLIMITLPVDQAYAGRRFLHFFIPVFAMRTNGSTSVADGGCCRI